MKKLALVLAVAILVLSIPGAAFAADWDSHFQAKELAASVGLGLGFGYWSGIGFSVYPGLEYVVGDWKIGNVVPLALGVAGRGMISFDYWGVGFGLGPFAVLHLGLKGLDIPQFLQNLDFYTALGLVFSFGSYYTSNFGVGFSSYGGINYFVNPKFALYLEGNYWGYYGGTTLGVLFKLKK